ncbi:MAG: ASKHA domain-containing protein [Synergistaceae bacterium]|jgi:uncharacterized 2Fe-2S/4Fe-4S cluster protein (DUF4445 family)|nr:ASKHA domain-containing protein [Synergistaceae bacterium]
MKISVRGSDVESIEARVGETIAGSLKNAGVFLPMPCGGRGRCGKCAVLVKGDFPSPEREEAELLKRNAPEREGYASRIACLCPAAEGEVLIPSGGGRVSVAGVLDERLVYDSSDDGYGIAIDIGTTTISALLYSFGNGEAVSSAHEMNRQAVYGADVLSRIDCANREGVGELSRCLVSQLNVMLSMLISDAGIDAGRVNRIVAAGNTTMLHFLTGLDPKGIGVAPFVPMSLFGDERAAGELFPGFGGAELYLPPSVSAYVGADITCGILAAGIAEKHGASLLIDVGTNGEMALCSGSRITCCSTAAGPAFEGATISMGMPAVSGAVCGVSNDGGVISCRTIDGARPSGICGSGMISAVRLMLETGVLDGSGRILERPHDFERFVVRHDGELSFVLGESGVSLTQRDIRNIQLAKASIAAGALVLLKNVGITPDAVEMLYLSGGFGSTIDPTEASGIGLIPLELAGRTVASGNTSLSGAAKMLFSCAARRRAAEIASAATEISLSSSAEFMEEYVEQMPFYE